MVRRTAMGTIAVSLAVGVLVGHAMRRRSRAAGKDKAPGFPAWSHRQNEELGPDRSHQPVRSAGPEHMRDRPRRPWERVDEASDQSFPASDPPAFQSTIT